MSKVPNNKVRSIRCVYVVSPSRNADTIENGRTHTRGADWKGPEAFRSHDRFHRTLPYEHMHDRSCKYLAAIGNEMVAECFPTSRGNADHASLLGLSVLSVHKQGTTA